MTTATAKRPLWPQIETDLPWASAEAEDARFRKLLKWGMGTFCALGIIITLVPVPELTREQAERIPPQLAKVILEKKELPKPPPPKVQKPKPKEKKPEPKKPEPKKQPDKPKPVELKKPEPAKVKLAREKASRSGLMAMQDDLAAMRDSFDVAEVSKPVTTSAAATAQKVDRSVIADRSRTSSGGVSDSNLSRDTAGAQLAGRRATEVQSSAAEGAAQAVASTARRETSSRGEASIRSVMESNKGAIYAIYNRALRRDPTLQGKVTVQLVIEPDGSISNIKIVSSELESPALESKLLARIRLINFGSANVERATLNYSIDFLPS